MSTNIRPGVAPESIARGHSLDDALQKHAQITGWAALIVTLPADRVSEVRTGRRLEFQLLRAKSDSQRAGPR